MSHRQEVTGRVAAYFYLGIHAPLGMGLGATLITLRLPICWV